jgi:uncharacterized protein (TIGR02246 family)
VKRFVLTALFVLALAPAARAAGGVQEVEDAWVAAMNANDLEAVMKCYATDATRWLHGAMRLDGAEAIRATYAGWLGANSIVKAELINRKAETSGNLSVGWGEYTVTMKPKAGGDAVTLKGRFTDVAKKRNGKWQYVVDHASDQPAEAAH